MIQFNTIPEALEDLRQGKLILVTDDPERENEGDFICAAEFATTENVNFMATHGKGLICMPMSEYYVRKLGLPQMVQQNTDNHETAFTVSIDHVSTTTGISAAERSITAMACVQGERQAGGFPSAGAYVPVACQEERRPGAERPHRSHGRPVPAGGAEGVRSVLRDHAGGRHYDADAGAGGAGQTVQHQVRHHSGFAELSQEP